MSDKKIMVALDCGNTSFRTVLGEYENGLIKTQVIRQTPNYMVRIGEYYYWDILYIFNEFKNILKELASSYKRIDSIGVCTWGVDFSYFDENGILLGNPLSYRNTIGEDILSEVSIEERKKLFNQSGILCDKINSVYMMAGIKRSISTIDKMASRCLMIPDILNYFLTGKMINEPSELSTTQLVSARTREISEEICDFFGINPSLFGPIGKHGQVIGNLKKEIAEEIGLAYDIPVICVPSHDTASAVAAIPATEESFGFVSCGTWSLIGTELMEPLITEEVRAASLTNEIGAFNRITLLKNSAGMFIVNHLKKEYDGFLGRKSSWDEIAKMAEDSHSELVMDLNHKDFFNPGVMSKAIWEYLKRTGQVEGAMDWGLIFMAFYRSLALSFADAFEGIERSIGHSLEKIYVVGGGSMSKLLMKLTAGYTGKTIVICYGESTSMGNLMVQLQNFMPDKDLQDLRQIVANSYSTECVTSEALPMDILEKYRSLRDAD